MKSDFSSKVLNVNITWLHTDGKLALFPYYIGCYKIHKEKIEKWQEEMKELRAIDATNKEMNDRLNNVKFLLQTIHIGQ